MAALSRGLVVLSVSVFLFFLLSCVYVWWLIALTRRYLEQFRLDFGDHSSHARGRAGPEDEAVTPVFVVRLGGIFKVREDLVDRDAWEVGRQEFRLLLLVAVGPVVVVGGLDLLLQVCE